LFLLIFIPMQIAITVLPEVYQASATVLIEDQQIPKDLVRSTVTTALETRLQTISQEILSRSELTNLIERLDLYKTARAADAKIESLVSRMRKDIKIDTQGGGRAGTVAFTVSYRGRDPQKVADVTNTIASMYVEQNLEMRSAQASSTSEFLKSQLEEMQKRLEEMEKKVSAFKSAYAGELPHQQESNLASLQQLNTRLQINSDNQIRVSARLAQLEAQLAEASQVIEADSPDATAQRLAELKEELRQLREKYSDKYPDVIRLREQIQVLEEELQEQKPGETEASPLVAVDRSRIGQLETEIGEARTELKTLQAEAENLNASIASYQDRIEKAPLREQQFQVLMRDYDTTTELYRSLLLRQKEAELAETMERREKGERFQIIESALVPSAPAAPDRLRLRVASFVLALGLAVGVAFLLEQIDSSYHTLRELRKEVTIPVLVSIPEIVSSDDKRRHWRRLMLGGLATVAAVAVVSIASYLFCLENERLVGFLMW
jgi:polysaccharide chain length determinant protein (PEP-CTERM system associated)